MMATVQTKITIVESGTGKLMRGYKCVITLSISGKAPNTFPATTNNEGYFVVNTALNTLITITKNQKRIGAVLANKLINYYTAYSPKAVVKNCVCSNWKSIASVIENSKFVGYGETHTNNGALTKSCYWLAYNAIGIMGYTTKGRPYQIAKENSNGSVIYNKKEFELGVQYVKNMLSSGIPVMIGVHDHKGTPNNDTITDHFIVIVGMGSDSGGNYFLFHDNAVSDVSIGTSLANKLYCDCQESSLSGAGDLRNGYIQLTPLKKYIVSRILSVGKK
jgi:hypothetical protein